MDSAMNEKQTWLVIKTISQNEWCGANRDIRLAVWSSYPGSPEVLRNYLCKDRSGYLRGYYDGVGTFYVMKFHLRDDEWAEPQSALV